MTREQLLTMAEEAATKAAGLAHAAESCARSSDSHHWQAAPLAAAGSLWADVARARAAIAAALPAE